MIGLLSPHTAAAALSVVLLAHRTLAQTLDQHSFGFKFAGSTATDIVQCDTIHFSAIPVNTSSTYLGAPPYEVIAFEAGGLSDRQKGGDNSTDIPWLVRHSPGARLFVTIIDSKGDFGGFPAGFFKVVPGKSASCMPPEPKAGDIPMLSANVSNANLETCQPWGMNITGGIPPYSVQIIADNSPLYTNTTAPSTSTDRFTYINRADPQRSMIVAVSDSRGVFGISTQPVFTHGNTNTTCVGLNSSWRPAAAVEKEMEDDRRAREAAEANKRRMTIIGAVVGILGFILVCGIAFFVWRKVASRSVKEGQPGFDMEPVAAYFPPAGEMSTTSGGITTSADAYAMRQGGQPNTSFSSQRPLMRNPSAVSGVGSAWSYSQRDELPPLPGEFDPYTLMNPNTPPPPRTKADEAAAERRLARQQSEGSSAYYAAPGSAAHGNMHRAGTASVTSPSTVGASVIGTDDDGQIIVQHRDGGAPPMVLELPPAYDNSRRISALQQHQPSPDPQGYSSSHGAKH
ncbi:hypothetical protein EXIGLDRAFT_717817 [Exidia glandulosa HHB12029]|uniref:Mid2 domain-containing protein n=1 Tax=Exidia glandulosa HHB12029 TaxID=1314781 RepID=A0A165I3L1_EXIGL|nr:hypothetical protein EXIGLDRAFT_717817 [Exidia glandulosa HHB12029]